MSFYFRGISSCKIITNTFNFIVLDAYGTGSGGFNAIVGRSAAGTAASPTATPANANMMTYGAHGWDTAWEAVTSGEVQIKSVNLHSVSDHSTQILFWTTPAGSTTIQNVATLNTGLALGGVSDPGLGGLGATYINLVGGTLAAGAQVLTVTATQPASPVSSQNAININVAGAGSAAQGNTALSLNYTVGYTGASSTQALGVGNANAGTAGSLSASGNPAGNIGAFAAANASDTGYNFGLIGRGVNATTNLGIAGISNIAKNSGTNIGVMGMGINTGTTPVEVGGWFTLGQTTIPAVSAALIADTAGQSTQPIALFQVGQVTVASVNATGGITATLTNVAANEIVCYNTSGGLMSYEPSVAGCVPSDPKVKNKGPDLSPAVALAKIEMLTPGTGTFKPNVHLGDKEQVWLYADQVCAMDERLCAPDSSGTLNYDKVGALAYVVAALKGLKADNDNLRAEINVIRSHQ